MNLKDYKITADWEEYLSVVWYTQVKKGWLTRVVCTYKHWRVERVKEKKKQKIVFSFQGKLWQQVFLTVLLCWFSFFNKRWYFICLIVFFVKCFMYLELLLPLVFHTKDKQYYPTETRVASKKKRIFFFPLVNLIWWTCLRNNKCPRQGWRRSITKRYWHISTDWVKSLTCRSTKVLRFGPAGTMNVGAKFPRRCCWQLLILFCPDGQNLQTGNLSASSPVINISLFERKDIQ